MSGHWARSGDYRWLLDFGLRILRRFVQIEGAQQATVLAAQAFTSLIPFLVVAAAFGPGDGDLADRMVDRFGLEGKSAESVQALFNSSGEVESTVTWVGVIILILATLSFTRAMQRMFQRSYLVQGQGLHDIWRGYAWIAGFALWIALSAPLRDTFRDAGGLVLAVGITTITGLVLWLGTPLILLGTIGWRRLIPGALASAVLAAIVTAASAIYVPILMTWSADKYGLIGIAFSIQSWLVVMGFVIVIGAVSGAVTSELYGERIDRMARRRTRERAH